MPPIRNRPKPPILSPFCSPLRLPVPEGPAQHGVEVVPLLATEMTKVRDGVRDVLVIRVAGAGVLGGDDDDDRITLDRRLQDPRGDEWRRRWRSRRRGALRNEMDPSTVEYWPLSLFSRQSLRSHHEGT